MADGTVNQSTLPPPMVEACVDLKDFQFMPLDVLRLRDSSLVTECKADEFRAAVLLWCVAWHQVPAGSLPNSEASLAKYAGYGFDLRGWKKVRAGAMRGFVLCSDDRFYHAVIAEKANEAWDGKLKYRWRRECDRLKKAAQRARVDFMHPTFEQWKEHQARTGSDRWDVLEMSPGTDDRHSDDCPGGHDEDVPEVSQAIKGQGTGTGDRDTVKGQGVGEAGDSLRSSSAAAAPPAGDRDPDDRETSEQRKAREKAEAAQRLSAHTANAMDAYNAMLAKPNGLLPKATKVGIEEKRANVKRCLRTASRICADRYGSPAVTPQFWEDYFHLVSEDEFKSGRQGAGKGHGNWVPDFEYVTRPDTMTAVYEAALDGDDEAGTEGQA